MYIDTNIIIDLLRGEINSQNFFQNFSGIIKTSIIVKLELIDGLETKGEISRLQKRIFDYFQIEVIHINEEISQIAENIFTDFRHSRGISINYSLIAATAIYLGEPLSTHNVKHFNFIPQLELIKPY
ncbi:hypothetical protein A3D78_06180 [Candidatus Gottesmanbacteria bacterium RIFCSPHIGHO2_02_FULL_39_14]|uniref:PIN domain-containing protein n=2 Tax=Candidatus Gottesmaniibacteriota TaxID=1752720 RepID=A0A1F6A3T8_9BACT|nr:MAG: hypothetical protein A3D78_06180 [Candidatus Gottesmanbacteria bacterium RIFCSPHIGHO2_02_FULL_39_14]OGG32431.1 MAG: hypothetical protein A3I51_02580 [Candidatus Gottesmanbacteria bacterium RIFCSPLOWO2_02_FULL_38_8]